MLNLNKMSSVFIEQAANRLLALDAESNEKLIGFEDKTIHIQVIDLNLNYYFSFPAGSLIVKEETRGAVSAAISGKLNAFIAAATNTHSGDAIFTGELHFSGEINTARRFQELAQSLQIDWQEPFSQIFGDLMTHNLAKGISHFSQFVNQFFDTVHQDIPEYFQHEINVTPCKSEINRFLGEVDTTRSQADRLQARIQRLDSNH